MLKTDSYNNISYNGAKWASRIKTLLDELGLTYIWLQDTDSTAAKRGSVFIGLMTPNVAIWSRYQRAVLMR